MSVSEVTSPDGLTLASSVRCLARDVRDLFDRSTEDREWLELVDRIDRLQEVSRNRRSDDLSRWLASLRRMVADRELVSS